MRSEKLLVAMLAASGCTDSRPRGSEAVPARSAGVAAAPASTPTTAAPAARPVAEPEAPIELSVTTREGPSRALPIGPLSALPGPFHLVAARAGEIDWAMDGEGVTLVATVPVPVAPDGKLVHLQRVHDGLLPVHTQHSIGVSGVAGRFTRAGDGWLILQAEFDPGPERPRGVPIAYRWNGDGWQVLREQSGGYTRSFRELRVRGETVFATPTLDRLQANLDVFTALRGKPGDELERLAGTAPVPTAPPDLCTRGPWTSIPDGGVYEVAETCSHDGRDRCRTRCAPQLLYWPPGASEARVIPLPEVAAGEHDDSYPGPRVVPGLRDREIVVFGQLQVEGYDGKIAYLAAGRPEALRRVPLEHQGMACADAPVSALAWAEGVYWVVMRSRIWEVSAPHGVRPFATPAMEWPVLEDMYWESGGSGWQRAGTWSAADIGRNPPEVVAVARAGDDVWLRVNVPASGYGQWTQAVLKTGGHHAPEVLASEQRVMGEIWRRQASTPALVLRERASPTEIEAFLATMGPKLRAIEEVLQVYEAQGELGPQVIGVVGSSVPDPALLRRLREALGVEPTLVRPPPALTRLLYDKNAP